MGALGEDDAERVVSLIPDAQFLDVDSGHTVHIDKPELFIGIINRFFK